MRKPFASPRKSTPSSIQVSIAAPYPGTELFKQATDNGWMDSNALISGNGYSDLSTLRYSHLSPDEIEDAVERMYRRFYFRHRPILRFLREMATDRQMLVRRLREGGEFFDYLKERRQIARARHQQLQPQSPWGAGAFACPAFHGGADGLAVCEGRAPARPLRLALCSIK